MLLIPCPNCGDRDESEFDYGGRAIDFPPLDDSPSAWHQALHSREHSMHRIEEYWYHAGGCECWIRITRSPQTHEIGPGAVDRDTETG